MAPLKDAILNGLYSDRYQGHSLLSPQLLTNTPQVPLWLTIRQELLTCQTFTWAVAFITVDMLVPLKVVLADLAKRKISGTLITGDYLGFNSPQVFTELQKIPNLSVKIAQETGFHAKGYLFDHGNYQTILVGSANFTRQALLENTEWTLKVSSRNDATLSGQVRTQLAELLNHSQPLTDTWLNAYRQRWKQPTPPSATKRPAKIIPNQMQTAALKELSALVKTGAHRGLVVSATGTGKTYLGAFAVQDYQPHRFLYVVHREQVARKSLASFRRVIGGPASDFGLLTGNQHDFNAKYLFATVQTLSQPAMLNKLASRLFDYILIDEAHRVAAPSYQRVLEHFHPQFCLGMTATPERMDHQDVYATFDYHLAYEIRLRDALEADMLTPFHYVGIQDYELNGKVIDETTSLRRLVAPKRVQYILKQLNYYGYCGRHPRGLVFCSRQSEAHELARQFTLAGHPAQALTNEDGRTKRQTAVRALEQGRLHYIITVDLFNEGVDIPAVNQIVMLRNTQSSIVFIQQLGRGLRKYPGKDFVTVLDFIGNYKNNYLIPLALNHDTSRDQDRARAETRLPQIIGLTTINFSRIASERILASLDQVKLDGMRELRQSYHELKNKLGRVPLLRDFLLYGSTSPLVFAQNSRLANYGTFLCKVGEPVHLTKYENQLLSFVTKELLPGKRPHELVLLDLLMHQSTCSKSEFCEALCTKSAYVSPAVLKSVLAILSLRFFDVKVGKQTKMAQYGGCPVVKQEGGQYSLASKVCQALANPSFKRLYTDAITTGLQLNHHYDNRHQFTLYQRYDRKDVCRLLNWPLDVSAPMYGYRVGERECPVFITYQKDSSNQRNAVYHN